MSKWAQWLLATMITNFLMTMMSSPVLGQSSPNAPSVIPPPGGDRRYTLVSLGRGEARGINNRSDVVGVSSSRRANGDIVDSATIWENGKSLRLLDPKGNGSMALCINDQAEVGGRKIPGYDGVYHPIVWQGSAIDLWKPGYIGQVSGINTRMAVGQMGQVIPWPHHWYIDHDRVFMFDLASQVLRELEAPNAEARCYAGGINEKGDVVGTSHFPKDGRMYATIWESPLHRPRLLPNLGGGQGQAFAVNNTGIIVGYSLTATYDAHATIWREGVAIDLGVLPSTNRSLAYAINNSGLVVGESYDYWNGGNDEAGFLWERGVMRNINDLITTHGWWVMELRGINEKGEMCGTAYKWPFSYNDPFPYAVKLISQRPHLLLDPN